MKLSRTHRLIRTIQLLQAGRACSVDWLATEMGVSRRTVFRDIEVLKEAGIDCEFDASENSYRIDESRYLRPLNLSLAKSLSLMLMTRRLANEDMVPSKASAVSAGLKIESLLPPSIRAHCGALLENVDVARLRVSDVDSVTDVLLRFQVATACKQKVQIRYDSYGEKTEIRTVVHPYCVTFRSRGWYMVGHSETHRAVRTFKLDRILDFRMLKGHFQRPADFDIQEYFGDAWYMIRGDTRYHVEVCFGEKVAGNVEDVWWHRTQRTRRLSNGSLVFEVDVEGIEEISWWIMGYGDQAEVREPEVLRRLIASHAKRVATYYEKSMKRALAKADSCAR